MKRIRFRTIPLVMSLAALPALADAKTADVALDACARQIVSDFATRQGLAPRYTVKLDERQVFCASRPMPTSTASLSSHAIRSRARWSRARNATRAMTGASSPIARCR